MSVLAATIYVGEPPPLGPGFVPRVEAHLYGGGVPRLVAFEVTDGPSLERVSGAYAPDLGAETPHPVTDLLLAVGPLRAYSSVGQRLDTLSTKAAANYGRDFTAMVFTTNVEWGSDGYGRLFEARSQLEAHPYDGSVRLVLFDGASEQTAAGLRANLRRLDADTRVLTAAEDGP